MKAVIHSIRRFFFDLSLAGCPDCYHEHRHGWSCERHVKAYNRLNETEPAS